MLTSFRKSLIAPTTAIMMVMSAGWAVPAYAADGDATTAPQSSEHHHKGDWKPVDIEAHIAKLHDKLNITEAQTPQWNAVATAMRDSAHNMQSLIEKQKAAGPARTAVDDLKAYQDIAQAHVDGLKNLVPAFQALYDSMSDEQKKTADAVFQHNHHHHMDHKEQ
jgi:hypothetical protein